MNVDRTTVCGTDESVPKDFTKKPPTEEEWTVYVSGWITTTLTYYIYSGIILPDLSANSGPNYLA